MARRRAAPTSGILPAVRRHEWTAWSIDCAALCGAVIVLVAVGRTPFGASVFAFSVRSTLLLGWVVTAAAAVTLTLAAVGRRPPRASRAGFVPLAFAVGGLAAAEWVTAMRIVAVALGAALPLAMAWFVGILEATRVRVAFAVLAGATVIAAVAKIAVRDPIRELRCTPYCGHNPLLVAAHPRWVVTTEGALMIAALGWCAVTAIELVRGRWDVWRRASAAFAIAGVVVLGVGTLDRSALTVWTAPGTSMSALVPAFLVPALVLAAASDLRVVATRARLRGLADDLSHGLPLGGVAPYLRDAVRDQTLRLAYATPSGEWLDVDGHVTAAVDTGAATLVERDGTPIALIDHKPSSADGVASSLSPAVTVAVENERLQALARAELLALRASRRRVVERADATRRRLEHDLHDGAQQRLLVLGMELARAAERADWSERECYLAAVAHTQAALAELRHLVHEGLPPILDERGLIEALRSLAEVSPVPVRLDVDGCDDRRDSLSVERSAYALATSVLRRARAADATRVLIALDRSRGALTATMEHDGRIDGIDVTDDEDRVGAVGGELEVVVTGGVIRYEAAFP